MNHEVIDVNLWDRARWRGVAYGFGAPGSPWFLALVFQERDAAAEIFRSWRDLVGPADVEEQIRLAIIEGDIPGKSPGYTVHISPNPDRVLRLARQVPEVSDSKEPIFTYFTRQHRMDDPRSPHLAAFKEAFAKDQRYWLIAGTLRAGGAVDLNTELAIEKRQVVFRQAREIPQNNDVDSIVLARPEGARARWN